MIYKHYHYSPKAVREVKESAEALKDLVHMIRNDETHVRNFVLNSLFGF